MAVENVAPKMVLDCPMGDNDANATTIRGYLVDLLKLVWEEGEGFDGKRPFGNSSWESEPLNALAAAGLIEGEMVHDEGVAWMELDSAAEEIGRELISSAIESLGTAQ